MEHTVCTVRLWRAPVKTTYARMCVCFTVTFEEVLFVLLTRFSSIMFYHI